MGKVTAAKVPGPQLFTFYISLGGIIADLIAALTYLDKRCFTKFSSLISLETPSSDVEDRWKGYEVTFDSFE